MSDLETLQKENENLKNQIKEISKSLMAQIEAQTQMMNEQLSANLSLKTKNVIYQRELNELNKQLEKTKKELEPLKCH